MSVIFPLQLAGAATDLKVVVVIIYDRRFSGDSN